MLSLLLLLSISLISAIITLINSEIIDSKPKYWGVGGEIMIITIITTTNIIIIIIMDACLASQTAILSEPVKFYMKLLTANRYYALNDRTNNMLSQGEVDMSAATSSAWGCLFACRSTGGLGARLWSLLSLSLLLLVSPINSVIITTTTISIIIIIIMFV